MERNYLGVRKGTWTKEEDMLLTKCIEKYGEGKWHRVPLRAGLNRCRKSCRLRWLNYLRPNIKRGCFDKDEVDLIIRLHKLLGNKWSLIAGRLPGRTANDVKNFFTTHVEKKILASGKGNKIINTNNHRDDNNNVKEIKTITGSNIIKPRPWTFRKLNEPYDETMSNKNDKSHQNSDPAWSRQVGEADDCLQWWNKLLEQSEQSEMWHNSGEASSSSQLGTSGEYGSYYTPTGGGKNGGDENGEYSFTVKELDIWELLNADS